MQWSEVIASPYLQDLPFKIELDEWGKIIMCPVKLYHSFFQGEIEFLLRTLLQNGKALPECAIKTTKGTKVADVAWVSNQLWQAIKHEADASIAPEICVEVISASNTEAEMLEKKALYFGAGAKEVWIYWENELVEFFNANGQIEQSGYGVAVKLPK